MASNQFKLKGYREKCDSTEYKIGSDWLANEKRNNWAFYLQFKIKYNEKVQFI